MDEDETTLSGSLEENILTMLCWDIRHSSDIFIRFTSDIFSTRQYRKVAKEAFGYIQSYHAPPRAHLRDIFEEDCRKGAEGKFLSQILDSMEKLQEGLNAQYVLDNLDNFITSSKLTIAVEKAADFLQSGKLKAAQDTLFNQTLIPQQKPGIWLHEADKVLAFLNKDDADYFSTGIDVIDKRGVRPKRKALFLFVGPKGIGKSWFLVNTGKNAIMHHKSVLHITLEMSEEDVAKRYVQALYAMSDRDGQTVQMPVMHRDDRNRCTHIDFENYSPKGISENTRPEIAKKLSLLKSRSKLLIKEFPSGTLTVAHLNMYLDSLEIREGFKPDVIILDYVGIMSLDAANLRIDTGRTVVGLRAVAQQRDIAMVAASQGNRSSASARTVKADQIGEDWSQVQTADVVLTCSRTQAEKARGLARLFVAHARGIDDGYVVLISQSYASGQFCLDSEYMTNDLVKELGRITEQPEVKQEVD